METRNSKNCTHEQFPFETPILLQGAQTGGGMGSECPPGSLLHMSLRRPVHWFFKRSDGQWGPYTVADSDAMEAAYRAQEDELTLASGAYTVHVREREQRRLDNGTRRPVLRGTWFYQRSDGRKQPYEEDLAATLQQTFAEALDAWEPVGDAKSHGLSVEIGEDRKIVYIGRGCFVQVRGDQTLGRMVCCGFDPEGALPQEKSSQELLVVVPLEVRAGRANPIQNLAQGYVDGYTEGAEAARSMTEWMDGKQLSAAPALAHITRATHATSTSQALIPAGACGMTADARNQLKRHAGLGEDDDFGTLRPPNHQELPLVGRGRWYWVRSERDIQPFPDEVSAVTEVAAMRGVQVLQVQLDSREMTCLVQVPIVHKIFGYRSYTNVRIPFPYKY